MVFTINTGGSHSFNICNPCCSRVANLQIKLRGSMFRAFQATSFRHGGSRILLGRRTHNKFLIGPAARRADVLRDRAAARAQGRGEGVEHQEAKDQPGLTMLDRGSGKAGNVPATAPAERRHQSGAPTPTPPRNSDSSSVPHRWRLVIAMALGFVLCNMDKVRRQAMDPPRTGVPPVTACVVLH